MNIHKGDLVRILQITDNPRNDNILLADFSNQYVTGVVLDEPEYWQDQKIVTVRLDQKIQIGDNPLSRSSYYFRESQIELLFQN